MTNTVSPNGGKMRAAKAFGFSLDEIRVVEDDAPVAGPGQILVKVKAATLNYRDLAVLTGTYIPGLPLPLVPASDACGEVVATGEGVSRFKVGDRVTPIYTQGWHDGRPTPEQRAKRTIGAPLGGVLQDFVVVPAEDAVHAPSNLTDAEAACLPIAALTAWSALSAGPMKAGDTVLLQGTGGVSLFALQFAKMSGARVVILSSSDEKLERAKALGADVGINYKTTPEWSMAVKAATDGRGADLIVETIGSSLPESLSCVSFGGTVAVVGFVAGYETKLNVRQLIGPMVRLQGIAVGSRRGFEDMNRAIELANIKPVIDSFYPLEDVAEAFKYMKKGSHFGKIAVNL
ncbi:NADPH:quinone reductase-like Zn-dependent oxidoreductase [Rhizobium pisi]|uniref:NADPH:quinone reductase-like Zn-dependent oxidoreductase n=1 Tax=Rhizobium pisi TaxID=574561 RepID=A0A7W5BRC8_9HYPH|nr:MULTISPECIES: NAD(P)-dependent alcohol dehydrogenase [Rhizobium]MBB3136633.1 NADPH:quinone reductase-like Zn-dependent oxidoreductase [Rhizobium pisi]TCA37960.1 NAD(P)-dependent alcohol dehydrogenase [Rhizobium leguminosarum bv. viciae]TCA48136.1 NAD(P)-dependent alcohol dehydrogenase [Rhizobium leguminosarum bv. viciae]TCA69932.1 NAD(P)-dependent alcohol dehydrogenase [Rhizobium leguminosarum bv. viciae]